MDFNKLHEELKEAAGLNESSDWEICKDMEKGYFYICNDMDTLCDPDGEPYHFETREEAEEFLSEYDEEQNEDEFELIRNALREYSEQDDCFLEGYVTIEDIKNNYGLQDFTDSMIIECAKEEGYEVDGDKILDPCAE